MFHVIVFYTDGDCGTKNLQNECIDYVKLLNKHFHSVHVFSPKKLISSNRKWEKILDDQRSWMQARIDSESFRWNPTWAALNFLLWKPALLSEILQEGNSIKEGDLVLYHDIDFVKYPEYSRGLSKWKQWITRKLKCADVLVFNDNNTSLRCGVKREVIDRYLDDTYLDKPHIWAGAIAFKKSPHSRWFVNEWLQLTSDIDNRSQLTYSTYPGFIWHSQEQAMLAVAYYQNIKKPFIQNCFLYNSRQIPPSCSSIINFFLSSFSLKNLLLRLRNKILFAIK